MESGDYKIAYEYSYDTNGNMTKEIYKDNDEIIQTVNYIYDNNSKLIKKTVDTTEYDYTTWEEIPKTYEYDYIYDASGNWTKLEVRDGDEITETYTITYDENGNVNSLVQTSGDQTYTYTFEYELVTVPFVWQNVTDFEIESLYIDMNGLIQQLMFQIPNLEFPGLDLPELEILPSTDELQ